VDKGVNPKAYPAFKYMCADSSIAITPKSIIDKNIAAASLPLSLKLLIL
jgi:hypothetical protein